jgi:hypothetical protein
MDSVRPFLTAIAFAFASVASATPLDTAYDFLYAVEAWNGESFLETLTESLGQQLIGQLEELRHISLSDTSIGERLQTRFGITPWDLENLTTGELLGRILEGVHLYSADEITEEKVSMSGRDADVILYWENGGSLSFTMVWEQGNWRISGSDLFSIIFN